MSELTTLPQPGIWPECDCGAPFLYRRAFTMKGTEWLWMRDCKHPKKEQHEHRLMTADGPYNPRLTTTRGDAMSTETSELQLCGGIAWCSTHSGVRNEDESRGCDMNGDGEEEGACEFHAVYFTPTVTDTWSDPFLDEEEDDES